MTTCENFMAVSVSSFFIHPSVVPVLYSLCNIMLFRPLSQRLHLSEFTYTCTFLRPCMSLKIILMSFY
jgi:hypothetical protein